jgi:predicted ester cyclase
VVFGETAGVPDEDMPDEDMPDEDMTDEDMTAVQERNMAAVRTWIDAYNAQDIEGLAVVADDAFRVEDPATGTHLAGADRFADVARDVVRTYPDRHISVTTMIPLGSSAVAVQGDWDGTATEDTPTGAHPGDHVHHIESMLIELADSRITLMRIYR